jgi:hypothetical protein
LYSRFQKDVFPNTIAQLRIELQNPHEEETEFDVLLVNLLSQFCSQDLSTELLDRGILVACPVQPDRRPANELTEYTLAANKVPTTAPNTALESIPEE